MFVSGMEEKMKRKGVLILLHLLALVSSARSSFFSYRRREEQIVGNVCVASKTN